MPFCHQRLRTCSLPDVRLLFQTASSPGTFFQEQTTDDDQLDAGGKGEEQAEEEGEGEEEEEEDGELEDDEEDELQEIGRYFTLTYHNWRHPAITSVSKVLFHS